MVRLGQRLHDERKKRDLSLEEVAVATKIRASFLSAIEKGDYSKLPSPSYAQGFVLNYAAYLDFPRKEALALFRREFDERKVIKVLPENLTHGGYTHKTFRIRRTGIALIIIFLFLLGYLCIQYSSVFFGPPLRITYPPDKVSVTENINVTGSTDPNATVAVNGELASVDENGNFSKALTLLPGPTQIEIIARNRYGKTTIIDRTVEVK